MRGHAVPLIASGRGTARALDTYSGTCHELSPCFSCRQFRRCVEARRACASAAALMAKKNKPFACIDTHAGAGGYDLGGAEARRTGEGEAALRGLLAATARRHAGAVARYLAPVRHLRRANSVPAGARSRHYPGSPRWSRAAAARRATGCVACELHAEDARRSKREFAGDRQVEVRQRTATRSEGAAAAGGAARPGADRSALRGARRIRPIWRARRARRCAASPPASI